MYGRTMLALTEIWRVVSTLIPFLAAPVGAKSGTKPE